MVDKPPPSRMEEEMQLLKSLTLITGALVCSLSVASAQTGMQGAPTPRELPGLSPRAESAMAQNASRGLGGVVSSTGVAPQLAIGWYVFHVANCISVSGNSAFPNGYRTVYPFESGIPVFFAAVLDHLILLGGACSSGGSSGQAATTYGNWIGFHVIDAAGDFDQIETWNFK
ncbi:MAG: hypothetical protein JOZ17_07435 [Acetobacteraceae bacterium]|nr:hypothetical protein [Acetobacteraceae bacterium]